MREYTFQEYRAMFPDAAREDCPLQKTLALFQGRWTLQVIFELSKAKNLRFGELKKRIPRVTNTMLTSTLRNLEKCNLVTRIQYNEIPPHVEYALSEAGRDMYPIFVEMAKWGKKHLTQDAAR